MTIPAAERLHLQEEEGGVRIPLEWNLNDKGCLFAGSIYAGAIIAAYRAAERLFAARGLAGELVAKAASVSYSGRIVSDGRAVVSACGEPLLKANGNHVLAVTAEVCNEEGAPCAEVKAEFVLLARRRA